jgi:hypothetical protein
MIAVTFPNEPPEYAIRQRWRDTRYFYITIACTRNSTNTWKHFKLFGFPVFLYKAYLTMVILETRRAH